MLINVHSGTKDEWVRWVKFGLKHKDRMPAASDSTGVETSSYYLHGCRSVP
jgi:hypothetical protein